VINGGHEAVTRNAALGGENSAPFGSAYAATTKRRNASHLKRYSFAQKLWITINLGAP
jgi:hypothetical protein